MNNLYDLINEKVLEVTKKHLEIIEKEFKSITDLGYKNNELGLMYIPENEYKIFDKKSKSILSHFKINTLFTTQAPN